MSEPLLFASAQQDLSESFGDIQAMILENASARLTQTVVRTDDCHGLSAREIMDRRRPLRILCAEDNELLGDVMLQLFAKAGHWVEYFENGRRAWERMEPDLAGFDVVVTDHQMPELTGLQLVERLRQGGFSGRVVVHCSGLTPEQAARYRQHGVQAIVIKSCRAEQLLAAVESS